MIRVELGQEISRRGIAGLRVDESSQGGCWFGKWRPFERGEMFEAAE